MQKKLIRHKKYAKILNIIERIITSFMLYFGGILISVCGIILLFSTTQVMEFLGLKIGISGLLLVMASSLIDSAVLKLTELSNEKIKEIEERINQNNNSSNCDAVTKENKYIYNKDNNLVGYKEHIKSSVNEDGHKVRKLIK